MDQSVERVVGEDVILPSPVVVGVAASQVVVDDVHGIIARAVSLARSAGRDYVAQCHSAAAAVVAVRPDLSLSDALNAVYRLRELGQA